jgi:hypothetical protein
VLLDNRQLFIRSTLLVGRQKAIYLIALPD